MDCLKIVNIKVSCFFNEEMIPQVVKENGKVFTVYRHSKKLMNISGIKCVNELYKYQYSLKCHTFRIDNIMFARKCNLIYNMHKLCKRIKAMYGHKFNIHYDQELQSAKGIYIIPKQKPGFSLVCYRTGSSTIMGAKHLNSKRDCEEMLKNIYNKSCLILK